MNQKSKLWLNSAGRDPNFNKNLHEATQGFLEDMKTMTREEMAEKLTTYEPGVPHFWFGRPVEPITKEELLAFWNGGPDIEPRYLDDAAAKEVFTRQGRASLASRSEKAERSE